MQKDPQLSANFFHDCIAGFSWMACDERLSLAKQDIEALEAVAASNRTVELSPGVVAFPAAISPWDSYHGQVKSIFEKSKAKHDELNEILQKADSKIETLEAQKRELELQLKSVRASLAEERARTEGTKNEAALFHGFLQEVQELMDVAERARNKEQQFNADLHKKLAQTPLAQWTAEDLPLALWRMDLLHRKDWFAEQGIDGDLLCSMTSPDDWRELGLTNLEASRVLYHASMMQRAGYAGQLLDPDEDCVVCQHVTPQQTRNLLKERDIPLDVDRIQNEGWVAPYLIYASMDKKQFGITGELIQVMRKIKELRKAHEEHLQRL